MQITPTGLKSRDSKGKVLVTLEKIMVLTGKRWGGAELCTKKAGGLAWSEREGGRSHACIG